MQSCLGLYIEDNLIKYAKVSQNKENIRVESFGVKFFENANTAIKQIVEETYSFKDPISVNTDDEWYNEIRLFSLLAKKDMENAIKTEFENICYTREINQNAYEQKKIYTYSNRGEENLKVIHIAVPKTSLEQKKNQLSGYRLNCIVPLSVSIADLIEKDRKNTNIIVNIEKETTITKVINGIVSDIKTIKAGSGEILDKINKKENSYSKSYEICKSSTIYTDTDKDLQYEENEYLEDIMPTLFQIVTEVKNEVSQSLEKVEKVYITGTGALVNNIDIYFQEYLGNTSCEILKPVFINNNLKINIKDYIEVNSAIAIAIQGLNKTNKNFDINFKGESGMQQLSSILSSNLSDIRVPEVGRAFNNVLGKFGRQFDLLSITIILGTILYLGGTIVFNNQLNSKIEEADRAIANTNASIEKIKKYNKTFEKQTSEYKALIRSIDELNNINSESKRYRNSIPNLLNRIMAIIPRGVQLTVIQNTSDSHVIIGARSDSPQQIAYFKTLLKEEKILKEVVSDTGTSQDGYLNVTIEGELP